MIRSTLAALLLLGVAVPAAAPAQQPTGEIEVRVGRIEKQLRAVQRKVFPGADPQLFDAEITPAAPPAAAPGTPAGSAVGDLTARVDAIERELQRLTGQAEQTGYRLRQLEDQFTRYRTDTDAKLAALAPAAVPAAGAAGADTAVGDVSAAVSAQPLTPPPAADRPAATPPAAAIATAPAAAAPSGDPAEDAYMAGYRLWEAKRYGEAETALQTVVDRYPKHRRASFAQNLIGRSYLDDGKPALAAKAFYASYQNFPRGERAPDSLYYLGQALMQLKKPTEACKVYAELEDVYGPKISEAQKGRLGTARAAAKCGA